MPPVVVTDLQLVWQEGDSNEGASVFLARYGQEDISEGVLGYMKPWYSDGRPLTA